MSTTRSLYRAFARLDTFPSLRVTLISGGLLFVVFSVLAGLHIRWMSDDLMSPLSLPITIAGPVIFCMLIINPPVLALATYAEVAYRLIPGDSFRVVKVTPVDVLSLRRALWFTSVHWMRVPLSISFAVIPLLVGYAVPANFMIPHTGRSPLIIPATSFADGFRPALIWLLSGLGLWALGPLFTAWGSSFGLAFGRSAGKVVPFVVVNLGSLLTTTLIIIIFVAPMLDGTSSPILGGRQLQAGLCFFVWTLWPFFLIWLNLRTNIGSYRAKI